MAIALFKFGQVENRPITRGNAGEKILRPPWKNVLDIV